MVEETRDNSLALYLSDARFGDFDELAEAIEGWDLDWQQLDYGPLDAGLHQVQLGPSLITRVRFDRRFRQGGGFAADYQRMLGKLPSETLGHAQRARRD